jgi:ectoine hydroxylase-related dioxygenase (phytanoyl-CoA dioxygenase family)
MSEVNLLSAEEQEFLPSEKDLQFYAEHGWYLSNQLLANEEVEILRTASQEYYAGHRDRILPVRPTKVAAWTPAHGEVHRNNDYIHYENAAIGTILRKPLIAAVAARLAGAEMIRIFQATLLYKPANAQEKTNIVPWHFDKYYWATCSSDRMLTAFIPFHDCDESMGTLTMVDGSHRWHDLRGWNSQHGVTRDQGDIEREYLLTEASQRNGVGVVKIPVTIPAGHMTFHHCRLYHGSTANVSSNPRQSISFHLQDESNSYQDFRQAPDCRPGTYKHDELLRRNGNGDPDYHDPEFCPVLWPSPER